MYECRVWPCIGQTQPPYPLVKTLAGNCFRDFTNGPSTPDLLRLIFGSPFAAHFSSHRTPLLFWHSLPRWAHALVNRTGGERQDTAVPSGPGIKNWVSKLIRTSVNQTCRTLQTTTASTLRMVIDVWFEGFKSFKVKQRSPTHGLQRRPQQKHSNDNFMVVPC